MEKEGGIENVPHGLVHSKSMPVFGCPPQGSIPSHQRCFLDLGMRHGKYPRGWTAFFGIGSAMKFSAGDEHTYLPAMLINV